jgi:hypothetical protein
MTDLPSLGKVLLNGRSLVDAFCMHATHAEDRQWDRSSIDGDRVGNMSQLL